MGTAPPTRSAPEGERTSPPGSPPGWRLDSAQLSDVGRVRSENQDACGAFRDASGWRLFVVADGMGGHRGGATASRMCVETLGHEFQTSQAPVRERLVAGLVEANRAIRALAEQQSDLGGMGTTAVALALAPSAEGWIAWVGDSRGYRLRDGRLEALTEDHSLVAEWVRLAVIRPEEAAEHPRRNELLRSVGPLENVQVDAEPLDVRSGDRYLLCSDGLWGEVSDPEMAAVLGFEEPETAVARLVELANSRGAPDNVTVQIAAIGVGPAPAPRVEAAAPAQRARVPLLLGGGAVAVALALGLLLWFAATRETGTLVLEPEATAVAEVVPEQAPEPESVTEPTPPPSGAPQPQAPEATPQTVQAKAVPVAALAPEPEPTPKARVAPSQPQPALETAQAPPAPEVQAPPLETAHGALEKPMGERPFVDTPVERHASPPTSGGIASGASASAKATAAAVPPSAARTGDAQVQVFLEQWARAIRTRDFALYQRLGLPSSRAEFEQRYPAQSGAQVDVALLEHQSPAPGEHRVRVKLGYGFDSGTGMRRFTDEQRIVLRERFGVLRYASRWR